MRLPRNFFARCSLRSEKSRPDHLLHRLPPSEATSLPTFTSAHTDIYTILLLYFDFSRCVKREIHGLILLNAARILFSDLS
jgi:hypothetical protein